MKRCRGFSILDAIVGAVILAVGLVALAALQARSLGTSGDAKTRTVALSLAQEKLETFRNFQEQATASNVKVLSYELIPVGKKEDAGHSEKVSPPANSGSTVDSFTRSWEISEVSASSDPKSQKFKKVDVFVAWTDATGASMQVQLSSMIGQVEPLRSTEIYKELSATTTTSSSTTTSSTTTSSTTSSTSPTTSTTTTTTSTSTTSTSVAQQPQTTTTSSSSSTTTTTTTSTTTTSLLTSYCHCDYSNGQWNVGSNGSACSGTPYGPCDSTACLTAATAGASNGKSSFTMQCVAGGGSFGTCSCACSNGVGFTASGASCTTPLACTKSGCDGFASSDDKCGGNKTFTLRFYCH